VEHSALNCYIGLLRGINVGGNNKLPMKDLAAMFTVAGCGSVATYIQSGNVVFRAEEKTAARIPTSVSDAIEKQFGFRAAVLIRTASELRKIAESNPFTNTDSVHVAFLAPGANTEPLLQVNREQFLPDEFALMHDEVYLYLPNGVGKSKLALAVDTKLRKACTMRNWRTVMALMERVN
jgi:uncharacterized protein (DUF1697 family)